ncbi:MAG TPA: DUF2213 domain-containing protein [Candidatus Limnocylindria bacterium]|nr:DUF2213 domain-containing protein [Candidatus Limnocylindria bacterium]
MRLDAADTWEQRTDAADSGPLRYDRGELLRPVAPVARTDGALQLEGYAARPGIYLYRNADGSTRRELVPRQMLLDSSPGLARLPVTLEHPQTDVGPGNFRRLAVGDTDGEVVYDNGFQRVKIAVRDEDAIAAVRKGKRELSPGYRVSLDNTPGVDPEFGAYDAVQTSRTYNHLAIVDTARGGPEVRLRADSGDAVATTVIERRVDAGNSGARPQGARMDPRIAALVAALSLTQRFDSDETALDAALAELRRRKDAEDEHQRKLDAANAERDREKARADAAEAKVRDLEKAEKARVDTAERAELGELAKALGIDPQQHADGGSLSRAIASKHLGSEVRSDASVDYVRALVDLAKAQHAQRGDGREHGRAAWQGGPGPADPPVRRDGEQRKDSRQRYFESLGLEVT